MRRHGFTLIELLVVVSIIALLIAILLPSLRQARDTANWVACTANERQIITCVILYGNDHQQLLPPSGRDWPHMETIDFVGAMWRYLGPAANQPGGIMTCPADDKEGGVVKWFWNGRFVTNPLDAGDWHPDYVQPDPMPPDWFYKWYRKMYNGVSESSGVVTSQMEPWRIGDVKYPAYLMTMNCMPYWKFEITAVHGQLYQGAFIDGHAGTYRIDDLIEGTYPTNPYNFDWTRHGIRGRDVVDP